MLVLILSIQTKELNAQNGDTIYFNQQKPIMCKILNSEIPVASTFTTNAKIYFGDTITIDSLSYPPSFGICTPEGKNIRIFYPPTTKHCTNSIFLLHNRK